MLGGWSSTIDPIQLADKGARLCGELPLKGMARLVEMSADADGTVCVDLEFGRGSGDGLRVMRGAITACIYLTCQRCMQPMRVELKSEPRLVLLRAGEREDLLEAGEAMLVEHPLTLGALVEHELLLEMPMVPLHPVDRCPAADRSTQQAEAKRSSPFSVLERLKRTDR